MTQPSYSNPTVYTSQPIQQKIEPTEEDIREHWSDKYTKEDIEALQDGTYESDEPSYDEIVE